MTIAVAGRRSSPATISRFSSRPTTKKKMASRPSFAHVTRLRSRCKDAGPTTVSLSDSYASAPGEFAQMSAATAPTRRSSPPARSVRRMSAIERSVDGVRRAKSRPARVRVMQVNFQLGTSGRRYAFAGCDVPVESGLCLVGKGSKR